LLLLLLSKSNVHIYFSRLLIDASDPDKSNYISLLEQVLKEEDASISDILITHWHHDHIGGVKDIKARKLIDGDCKLWKFPRSDAKEDHDLPFLELKDGHEFVVDGKSYKVAHTPGHTTDHVILYESATNTVFAGDNILGEGTAVFEDLFDYMKTLNFILGLQPLVIYPGHGDIIDDGAVEKIQFYINHRNERERQILEALTGSKEPLTDMGIVKIVYTTTPRHLYPAAAVNVHQHLIKLKKEGKIVEIDKDHETYWQSAVAQGNKL